MVGWFVCFTWWSKSVADTISHDLDRETKTMLGCLGSNNSESYLEVGCGEERLSWMDRLMIEKDEVMDSGTNKLM